MAFDNKMIREHAKFSEILSDFRVDEDQLRSVGVKHTTAANLGPSYSCSLKTEEWMTTEEAAAYLKISVGSLRNMTSNGQIPYRKLGRRNRYLQNELRDLLLSQKRGT